MVKRTLPLLLLVLLVLLAAGCGGGSKGQPIPAASANQLVGLLGEADRRVADHSCKQVKRSTLRRIDARIAQLPPTTDPTVRSTLRDGVDHLKQLVDQECRPRRKRRPTPTQTQTTPTQTQTTPTQTQTTPTHTQTTPTQTQTTPTQTQTTPTTTTPPKTKTSPPPSGGGGKGNGKGGKKAQGATQTTTQPQGTAP